MQEATLICTPDGVDVEFQLAGPASRLGAYTADTVLFLGLWALFFLAIFVLAGGSGGHSHAKKVPEEAEIESIVAAVMFFLFFLSNWGYMIFFEMLMRGQTPGKRLAGLRVIRQDGLPIGLKESLLRNLCRAVDILPTFYFAGFIVMMVDPLGRRVGDLVAGTLTVRESLTDAWLNHSGAAWAARAEKGQAQRALSLERGTLTARHLAVVEQFLERRASLSLGVEKRQAMATNLAHSIKASFGDDLLQILERQGPERLLERISEMAREQEAQGQPSGHESPSIRPGALF